MRILPSLATSLALAILLGGCRDSELATAPLGDVVSIEGPSTGYTSVNLETFETRGSEAIDINDGRQIVGSYSPAEGGRSRAFAWEEGEMHHLASPYDDGLFSNVFASSINENGEVVGIPAVYWSSGDAMGIKLPATCCQSMQTLNDHGQVILAFGILWDRGNVIEVSPPDGTGVILEGINNLGQVAGSSLLPSGDRKAFRWENGLTTEIGTLGGSLSFARGITDDGRVLGVSRTETGDTHVFVWNEGTLTDLTPSAFRAEVIRMSPRGDAVIGGSTHDADVFSLYWRRLDGTLTPIPPHITWEALNDHGQVVGHGLTADGAYRAWLWDGGELLNLGTLPGGTESWAVGINNRGDVVGASLDSFGKSFATLWLRLTPVEQLEQLAVDISDMETAGVINRGQANSLTSKLSVATAMLNDGKESPAVNQLEALVNQIEALIEGGVLTPEEGQPLIDAAQVVIDNITGS